MKDTSQEEMTLFAATEALVKAMKDMGWSRQTSLDHILALPHYGPKVHEIRMAQFAMVWPEGT